jgi:predicted acyltransferase
MAVASAPAPTTVGAATPQKPDTRPDRLMSLDVFRGLTMLLLISHGFGIHEALRNNASMAWLAYQFEHAAWVGCTLWDLIQPAFTFIVGVAVPLSIARRKAQGATSSEIFKHVLWRAFALIALSNVLSNWNSTQPLKLQFINVLCQIAFSYVLCFLILQLRFYWQVAAAAGLMVAHHGLFYLFPGPDGSAFSQAGNVGAQLDLAILGYNYSGYYTTLNFLGNAINVLFGVWTGMLLAHYQSHKDRIRILALSAAGAFALGLALAPVIPMVKRLWLGSFTFFSAGWVLLAFLACYYAIEVKGARGKWTFPAIVLGTNCIFIYSFSQVLHGWLSRGLGNFTGKFAFLGSYGAIPHNIVVLCAMWYLCYWLYQRRIFFKL